MIVTNVRIIDPVTSGHAKSLLLAFADVELDQMLVIHGIKLIQPENGLAFIDFPSVPAPSPEKCLGCRRKVDSTAKYCPNCGTPNSCADMPYKYSNLIHPICAKGRRLIHEAVVAEYRRLKSASQEQSSQAPTDTQPETIHA